MKKYLLLLLILYSFEIYSQDTIKIANRIHYNVKNWPDTSNLIAKWYAKQNNGILLTFPVLENNKRIKIQDYTIIEKNGNALITKDSKVKNVFWIYPYEKTTSNNNQPELELEIWISLNKKYIYYPVSINGVEVFDNKGKLIQENINWQELSKSFEFKNGKYLMGKAIFLVNRK